MKEVPDEEGDIVLEQDDVLPLVNSTNPLSSRDKIPAALRLSNLGKSSYYHNQALGSPKRNYENDNLSTSMSGLDKYKNIQRSPNYENNSNGKYEVRTFNPNKNKKINEQEPEINKFNLNDKGFNFRNNYAEEENKNDNLVNSNHKRGNVFESRCYNNNFNSANKPKIQTKIVRFGEKSKYRGNEKLSRLLDPQNIIFRIKKLASALSRQMKINDLVSTTMFHTQRNKANYLSAIIRSWYYLKDEKKAEVIAPIASTYEQNPNAINLDEEKLNGIRRTIKLSNN